MAFVMLLSSLILLMVQLNDGRTKALKNKWEQRRIVAELGDKFVALGTLEQGDMPDEAWSCVVAGESEKTLTLKKDGNVVLIVKKSAEGVLLWQTAGFAAE